MLKLGLPLTAIEGRIGGNTYWTDQCGQHMREDTGGPDTAEERTFLQRQQNRIYRQVTRAWVRHKWTLHEVLLWQSYSQQHPRIGRKGNTYHLPPYQMFLSVNIIRVAQSLPIIYEPP